MPPGRPLEASLHVGSGIYLDYSEHISAIPIEKGRDPVMGNIADMFTTVLLMLEASNRLPLGCESCRAGQIPAAVAPVGSRRNGESRIFRNAAVAASFAMLFVVPALAQ